MAKGSGNALRAPATQPLDFLGGKEVEVAPQGDLPRTSFVSIEYPGILRKVVFSKDSSEHPSLTNALRSLSPLPPPYATPISALRHISQSLNKSGLTTLECKLGTAIIDTDSPGSRGNVSEGGPISSNEIYRHAIIGDFLDVHNVVLKITKRTWRRKKRDRHSNDIDKINITERREYTAVALGITRKVARFRNLADFQYDPGLREASESADGQREILHQSLAFHDHLRQMNIEALQSFALEGEAEEYEVEKQIKGKGKMTVSNIRLPPPPLFDRTDIPFVYGFHQNTTSNLRPYGKEKRDGSRPMRYVNKQKFDNLSPIQVSWTGKGGQDMKVPKKPHEEIVAKQKDLSICKRLEELFEKQPIWTRTSIENQFEPQQRRNLRNQKYHYAAYCYTINDGCWRDTLVRFGYDPRTDSKSRFYQKLTFQTKDKSRKIITTTKRFSVVPGTVERMESVSRLEEEAAAADEDEGDDNDSHIFDGVKVRRKAVNFLLVDVHDEYLRSLIYQEGEGILRNIPDRETGWYTQKHYDKIRYSMSLRFHRIHEGGNLPSKEECDAIIAQIENGQYTKPSKPSVRPRARSISMQ